MKKLIASFFIAVFGIASLTSGSVNAAGTPPQTDVTGVVTENHVPVAGAKVTVLCNGNTQIDTSTDAQGAYLVTFPSGDCPFGSTVKVTAEKDGKTGVKSGTVHGVTTKLNLAIVNVPIPEYGMIGMLIAGGAGAGFMLYSRRRQENQLNF